MIKLEMPVVVEGKYDKKRLLELLDAPIIETGGFRIYHDAEKLEMIRFFAKKTGVVVATDSDAAGFQIRNFLKSAVREGKLYHVYIPDVYGKERRKQAPSKEGKLGVEGMDQQTLISCFERAGVLASAAEKREEREPVSPYDFYDLGLSGRECASLARKVLCRELGFPENMTAKGLLPAVSMLFSREEFIRFAKALLEKEGLI